MHIPAVWISGTRDDVPILRLLLPVRACSDDLCAKRSGQSGGLAPNLYVCYKFRPDYVLKMFTNMTVAQNADSLAA